MQSLRFGSIRGACWATTRGALLAALLLGGLPGLASLSRAVEHDADAPTSETERDLEQEVVGIGRLTHGSRLPLRTYSPQQGLARAALRSTSLRADCVCEFAGSVRRQLTGLPGPLRI